MIYELFFHQGVRSFGGVEMTRDFFHEFRPELICFVATMVKYSIKIGGRGDILRFDENARGTVNTRFGIPWLTQKQQATDPI